MRGSERLILIGIVIVIIGIIIIALSSDYTGTGFFFIFPFFFAGEASLPIIVIAMASIFLMFLALFIWPLRIFSNELEKQSHNEIPRYVKLTSECDYCSSPIPEGSTFCPSCGSPLRQDSSDGYETMY